MTSSLLVCMWSNTTLTIVCYKSPGSAGVLCVSRLLELFPLAKCQPRLRRIPQNIPLRWCDLGSFSSLEYVQGCGVSLSPLALKKPLQTSSDEKRGRHEVAALVMQLHSSYKNTITPPSHHSGRLSRPAGASEVASRRSSGGGGAAGSSCREGGLGRDGSSESGEKSGRNLQRGIRSLQVGFSFLPLATNWSNSSRMSWSWSLERKAFPFLIYRRKLIYCDNSKLKTFLFVPARTQIPSASVLPLASVSFLSEWKTC